jgi:hypothetical protein
LETWVRLRFQLVSSDPMIAIVGAFGRLTDAGMDDDDATETVLRIMGEFERRAAVGAPLDTAGSKGPLRLVGSRSLRRRDLPVRATHAVKHPYHRTVPAKVFCRS